MIVLVSFVYLANSMPTTSTDEPDETAEVIGEPEEEIELETEDELNL